MALTKRGARSVSVFFCICPTEWTLGLYGLHVMNNAFYVTFCVNVCGPAQIKVITIVFLICLGLWMLSKVCNFHSLNPEVYIYVSLDIVHVNNTPEGVLIADCHNREH